MGTVHGGMWTKIADLREVGENPREGSVPDPDEWEERSDGSFVNADGEDGMAVGMDETNLKNKNR
jgi:hypothetical protein